MSKRVVEPFVAVIDVKTKRPACVLLQAVYGGDRRVCNMVSSRYWHVAPTDDMTMIRGTPAQWAAWAKMVSAMPEPSP